MLSVTTINITPMTTLNKTRLFTQKGEPSGSGKVRRTTFLKTTTMAKLSSSSSSVTIAKSSSSSSSHNNNNKNKNINSRQEQQFLINKGRRNSRGVLVVKASEGGEEADISVVERKRDLTAGEYVQPEITSRSTSGRLVPEEGFNAARTSFGTVGLSVGLPLLIYGFGAYFSFLPGTEISALMLIYGFPISLIGFALKYAELLPLECESYEDAVNVRDDQSTAVLTQLRNDVTRYRYGDEQHLEEAMNIIFKFNRPGGLQKRQRPKLVGVSEQMVNGRYAIVLTMESPKITKEEWDGFMGKFSKFFGPNVDAVALEKSEGVAEIILISNGGDDLGGPGDDMEVLPPLMPGLPARYQKRGTA